MKTLPTDPFALHDRMMDALIGDILDPKATTFSRLDALRETMSQSDKLVDRASRPQRHSEGDCRSGTTATREPSLGSRPSGRVSDYRKDANND